MPTLRLQVLQSLGSRPYWALYYYQVSNDKRNPLRAWSGASFGQISDNWPGCILLPLPSQRQRGGLDLGDWVDRKAHMARVDQLIAYNKRLVDPAHLVWGLDWPARATGRLRATLRDEVANNGNVSVARVLGLSGAALRLVDPHQQPRLLHKLWISCVETLVPLR